MVTPQPPIEVEVFGQRFALRSEKSAEDVRQIAAYVDHQLQQVAAQARTPVQLRVAIMAALTAFTKLARKALVDPDHGIAHRRAQRLSGIPCRYVASRAVPREDLELIPHDSRIKREKGMRNFEGGSRKKACPRTRFPIPPLRMRALIGDDNGAMNPSVREKMSPIQAHLPPLCRSRGTKA
jgi:hypothetical protein